MNIEEALAAIDAPRDCVVGEWLNSLDNKEQIVAELDAKLASGVPIHRLYRAAKLMGLKAAEQTWRYHFTKMCRCSA